ncbi:MAG: ATP-binding protein [bacterium]|jgi:PAS domain S-box-containing protein
MLNSIRSRLTASYVLLVVLTVSLLGTFLIQSLDSYQVREAENQLKAHARVFSHYAELSFLGNALAQRFGQDVEANVQILDINGVVVGDSRPPDERSLGETIGGELVDQALSAGVASQVDFENGSRVLHVAGPLSVQGEVVGLVYFTSSLDDLDDALRVTKNFILLGALVSLALALILGTFLAGGITRPLAEVTAVSRQLASGDFSPRLKPRPPSEVQELSLAFNYLTERLAATMKAIEEEQQKLATVLSSMDDILLAVDQTGTVVLANPACAAVLATPVSELIGHPIPSALQGTELEQVLVTVSKEAATKLVEVTLPGRETVYRAQVTPWRSLEGQEGAVAVLRDISDLKRLAESRLEFLANVSHELRTPLTSIKGFAVTLEDELPPGSNARRYAEVIEQETDRLSRLVADIMDLSKMDAREVTLDLKTLDLTDLIVQVVEQLLPRVAGKVELSCQLPSALPKVLCHPDQIRQVLLNLIDNAIKYTPAGGRILVNAWAEKNWVNVAVEDTGVGIPSDDLPRLFERFYRVDKARSRSLGGTGLGLAIVKGIISQHGGTVSVSSELGKGTKIAFSLPLIKPS